MSQGTNSAYGLKVVESTIGGGGTQKLQAYKIYASAEGTTTQALSIYNGDPVKFSATGVDAAGTIVPKYDVLTTRVAPTAALTANDATAFLGVFISCTYIDRTTGLSVTSNTWPGGTQVLKGSEIIALVNDDPMAIFKVQVSSAVAAATGAVFLNNMVGMNANLAVGGIEFTADGYTGKDNALSGGKNSAYYLDGSSIATTATLDVKIMRIAPSPFLKGFSATNAILTAGDNMPFIDVYVKFNKHMYGSAGVAGTRAI